MELITISEIIAMIIVTIVMGYIFIDMIRIPRPTDILDRYRNKKKDILRRLLFASLIASPGIILHELAHKFTAMALGYSAVFKMWTTGLVLAIFLKLIHSPILIIAPGYVQIPAATPTPDLVLIAFAGPFINLVLWIGSWFLLKKYKFSTKWTIALAVTKRINMILFIFNMIPIPPLDGSKIWFGLFQLLTNGA